MTVNYRLGPWGELSLDFGRISGNQGLRDQVKLPEIRLIYLYYQANHQVLALQWVQDNIAYFGGNPEEVAIWGESAGAWLVYRLT